MLCWYKKRCVSLKSIGDHKFYTTKDLILATMDHLVDLHLSHGYGNDTGIIENELIENRCGIQLNKNNYISSEHRYLWFSLDIMVPQYNKSEGFSNIKLMFCWGIRILEYGTKKSKGDNFKLINNKGSFLAITIFGVLSPGRFVELMGDSGEKRPRRFLHGFGIFQ